MTQHNFPQTLPDGALDRPAEALPDIPFDPVPRLPHRLARRGCQVCQLWVAAAARSVGMTSRNAYRLCDAAGAVAVPPEHRIHRHHCEHV